MTDADRGTFERAFERVSRAYRLKVKPTEHADLCQTYYRALDAWALDDVLFAIKTCIAKCKRFPTIADVVELLPASSRTAASASDLRHMTVTELDEHERAAALRFEDAPCVCDACVRAGVDAVPLRFVPNLLGGEPIERAFNSRRNASEVVGHWAHGAELAAWYAARDAFYTHAGPLARVFYSPPPREPGREG